jgi:hypothetical protein
MTTPPMLTSVASDASKWFTASSRKSGTVTTAARLLMAVIVTDSAVSPRARWVNRFAVV